MNMRTLKKILATATLLSPFTTSAAAPKTFGELAKLVVDLMNAFTAVLILAGIVIYFYGISINILKFGEGDKAKIKNYFVWGIIVLFVMVSVWGILNLLENTLFPTTGGSGGSSVPIRMAPTQGGSFQSPNF